MSKRVHEASPVEKALSGQSGRLVRILLRIAMSAILLTMLLRKITFSELIESFSRALGSWPLLIVAFLLPLGGIALAALRWQKLMKVQGVHLPVHSYGSALLVGSFVNQVLPSTVGGDLARGVWVTRPGESSLVNLAVVTLDRLVGIFSLCLLAFVCALASPSIRSLLPAVWMVPAILAAGVLVLLTLALRHGRTLGERLFSRGLLQRYRDKAKLVYQTLLAYRDQKSVLIWGVVLSIGLQLVIVMQSVLFAFALQLPVAKWELALIVPVVTLVSLLPVTVSGLGLREGSFALLGSSFGLNPTDAVALGWLTLAGVTIYGLWGAILQLRGRQGMNEIEES